MTVVLEIVFSYFFFFVSPKRKEDFACFCVQTITARCVAVVRYVVDCRFQTIFSWSRRLLCWPLPPFQ